MKLFSRFSTNPRWLLFLFIGLVLIAAISRTSPKGENKLLDINNGGESQKMRAKSKGGDYPPVLAYWVSGSSGDVKRMLRLLKAIYHPRNCYLLGFDAAATESERSELAFAIQSDGVFKGFGNVDVVGKSFAVDEMGCSGLSVTLHAAALLLKLSRDWDWFVPLSSSDYPLVSQDDLLHALTPLPRELNFIDYSNNNGWKERINLNQIVIDPNLYYRVNTPIMHAVETRTTPDAFKIFGGSPYMILTRDLMEFCIQGWDNFPRKLLMYLTNTAYPQELYFQTVICNTPEFLNTTINTTLRYINHEPSQYHPMISTRSAFGRPFKEDDPVLQKIDETVLNRTANGFVQGEWCLNGGKVNETMLKNGTEVEEVCSGDGNIDVVKPSLYGIELRVVLRKLVEDGRLKKGRCQEQHIT